jgi:hypothetical protein
MSCSAWAASRSAAASVPARSTDVVTGASRDGHGNDAETESGETPRITPLFRVGESSHGTRGSLRDLPPTQTTLKSNHVLLRTVDMIADWASG